MLTSRDLDAELIILRREATAARKAYLRAEGGIQVIIALQTRLEAAKEEPNVETD